MTDGDLTSFFSLNSAFHPYRIAPWIAIDLETPRTITHLKIKIGSDIVGDMVISAGPFCGNDNDCPAAGQSWRDNGCAEFGNKPCSDYSTCNGHYVGGEGTALWHDCCPAGTKISDVTTYAYHLVHPQSCFFRGDYAYGMIQYNYVIESKTNPSNKDGMITCWEGLLQNDVEEILTLNEACRGRYLYAHPRKPGYQYKIYEITPLDTTDYSKICQTCPENSQSPSASPSSSHCKCNAGYVGPDGGPCAVCPTNSDSPGGNATCACNAGYSLSGPTGPDGGECVSCVAGKYKVASGNGICTNCGIGSYSAVVGASDVSTCLACPTNSDSPLASSVSTTCLCNAGYFGTGECEQCIAGT